MKRKAKNCSHCLRCIACAGRHEIAIWPEALTDVVQRPIAPKKQKTHSTLKNNASNQSPESLHKLQDGCCAVTDFVHCHMHVKCTKPAAENQQKAANIDKAQPQEEQKTYTSTRITAVL